jgi:hypothetical protein
VLQQLTNGFLCMAHLKHEVAIDISTATDPNS